MSQALSTEVKSIKEMVTASISANFVSLLPPSAWTEMVSKEIDNFMKPNGEFETMIKNEIRKLALEEVSKAFHDPEYKQQWANKGKPEAAKILKSIVLDNASEVFALAFAGLAQGIVDSTTYKISQDLQNMRNGNRY